MCVLLSGILCLHTWPQDGGPMIYGECIRPLRWVWFLVSCTAGLIWLFVVVCIEVFGVVTWVSSGLSILIVKNDTEF